MLPSVIATRLVTPGEHFSDGVAVRLTDVTTCYSGQAPRGARFTWDGLGMLISKR